LISGTNLVKKSAPEARLGMPEATGLAPPVTPGAMNSGGAVRRMAQMRFTRVKGAVFFSPHSFSQW